MNVEFPLYNSRGLTCTKQHLQKLLFFFFFISVRHSVQSEYACLGDESLVKSS